MCRAGNPKTPEVRASGVEYVGAAPSRTVGESSPTSESLSDRLSKKIMNSYERLRSASGARLRSSSDRLQSRVGSTNSLALEVRASSQTQVSRGFVRPAQTGSSPSWHLTPAWRGVGVCRAREDEKSSRSVVRSQSAVPCVGRASARDPHTKDTVEEATGDSGRGSLRDGPSSCVAATRDHASLPLSRKTADTTEHTLLHPLAPRTSQEFTHSLTRVLCSHAACTRKTAQHETPTCARCSCLLFQVWLQAGRFVPSSLRSFPAVFESLAYVTRDELRDLLFFLRNPDHADSFEHLDFPYSRANSNDSISLDILMDVEPCTDILQGIVLYFLTLDTDSNQSHPLVPEMAQALEGQVEARQHSPRMRAGVRHMSVWSRSRALTLFQQRQGVTSHPCPCAGIELRWPVGPTSFLTEHPHCWRQTSPRGSCVPAKSLRNLRQFFPIFHEA